MMEETLKYPEKFKTVILYQKRKYSLSIYTLVGCYTVLTGS